MEPDFFSIVYENAVAALRESAAPISRGWTSGKPRKPTFSGATFSLDEVNWVAAKTRLVSENAYLLDAAVAFKTAKQAERAVAILFPPNVKKRKHPAPSEFLRRYSASPPPRGGGNNISRLSFLP